MMKKILILMIMLVFATFSVHAATLDCSLLSNAVVTVDQFGSTDIELACTSTGGTSSNIVVSANANPTQGVTITTSNAMTSSLASEESDSVVWTLNGASSGTYTVSFSASTSDGSQSISATVEVTVAEPPKLTVEYSLPPSILPVAVTSSLNVKITNIGGQTASDVYLQLNTSSSAGDLVSYPTTIPAGQSRTYTWTINTNDTYTTNAYLGSTFHDSVSTYVAPNAEGITGLVGWNLISPTRIPPDTSADAVLAKVAGNYSIAYAWNASNQAWLKKIPNYPQYSTFTNIDSTRGFWIRYTNSNTTLAFNGSIASSISITLQTGWNLIGFPLSTATNITQALSPLNCLDSNNVWTYNNANSSYLSYAAGQIVNFEQGKAYWIKTNSSCVLTI